MNQARILEQLQAMVASGRVTEEEAAELRAAKGPDEFERAMGAIRARHAGVHMEAAVASGDMAPEEADAYLTQLRRGEHPKGLRARLSEYRRLRGSSAALEGSD